MDGLLHSAYRLLYYPEDAISYYSDLEQHHARSEREPKIVHQPIHLGCSRSRGNWGSPLVLDLWKWPHQRPLFMYQSGKEKGMSDSGDIEPGSVVHNIGGEVEHSLRQPRLSYRHKFQPPIWEGIPSAEKTLTNGCTIGTTWMEIVIQWAVENKNFPLFDPYEWYMISDRMIISCGD